MKKIAVITATRAEYGLLEPVLKELRKFENDSFCVELVVTGTHLSDQYGYTIQEIENDDERIDCQISISVDSHTIEDISGNQADALTKFTTLFVEKKYSGIVVLGDRYETLAIAIAAANTKTPIFHLCGGDTTEGAMDEWIRHAITKMSYLHFTTCEESRNRVIQLGENPSRVFNFGSTSIDNIIEKATLTKKEVLKSIGMEDCIFALCTYHPVTMESESVDIKIDNLVRAISYFKDIQFIVTKSNADQGGERINKLLDYAEKKSSNIHVYTSLGVKRYLSLMKYSEFVLGNSSSGIIETPVFRIPTVNIGNRQRGRLQADSIINCKDDEHSIVKAIEVACSEQFQRKCKLVNSPYGNGNAAEQISAKIMEVLDGEIDLKKKFYDLGK